MIAVDDDQIKQFESDLKTFASRAYPFATKNTINQSAFMAMRESKENVRSNMITRNKFTERSIQVEQTRTLNVNRQAATVGSIADYMEVQEFGGTKTKRGKVGVPIATTVASGEGEGAQPRRRLPRRPNMIQSIRLGHNRAKARTKGQKNFIAIQQAATTGRKFVFLDLQEHPGIYRITGGKKNPRIKLIHDMSKQSVSIPRNPWLAPAVKKTEAAMPELYKASLIFQLKRQRLFKG